MYINRITSYKQAQQIMPFNRQANSQSKINKPLKNSDYKQFAKLKELKTNSIIDDTSQFSNIKSCLREIESLVNRTKDLVEFATKETLAYDDRVYISEEISNLSNEIDRNYNNNAKEFEDISSQAKSLLGDAGSLNISLNAETLNLNKIDVSTSEKASNSLDICNKAKYTISNYIASLNKFENILKNETKLTSINDNLSADKLVSKLSNTIIKYSSNTILNSSIETQKLVSLLNNIQIQK